MKMNSSKPMAMSRLACGRIPPGWWWVIGPSMMPWITFGIDAAAARLPSWAMPKMTTRPMYGRRYGR